jgi:hypothetical protein
MASSLSPRASMPCRAAASTACWLSANAMIYTRADPNDVKYGRDAPLDCRSADTKDGCTMLRENCLIA